MGKRALPRRPIPLGDGRTLTWLGWTVADRRVSGSFRLSAARGAQAAPTIELISPDAPPLRCVPEQGSDRVWRFESWPPTLPTPGLALRVQASVDTVLLPDVLELTGQEYGLVGHLDPGERDDVQGWASDLDAPRKPVRIAITIDGVPLWSGAATHPRDDVAAAGLPARSGFRIPFPRGLDRHAPHSIAATIVDTPIHLPGSPWEFAPLPTVIGFFDALEGPFAGGWAVNMPDPRTPLRVEAVCDGVVVGQGKADLFRGDVEKAGMPTARCGFRFLLDRPVAELVGRDVHIRVVGTDLIVQGSPRQISQNDNIVRCLTRAATMPRPLQQRLARRLSHATANTRISIVMPVFDPRREWLIQAINSVLGQWSAHWELICVDDASTLPHVAEVLDQAAKIDPRIRVLRSPVNRGIAAATNYGLRAARGTYVAFMDHDDTLEPDAVYRLARAAQDTDADLLYTDEALTTEDIDTIIEVRARPAFSWDYYVSHPYFVHLLCVRTAFAHQLQGWDESLRISADVDFVLRGLEQAKVVTHVPGVLYRWRTHGGSTGHARAAEVTATTRGIIARHLERRGLPATVQDGHRFNEYRLDWPDDGGEVLVVIPTKNRVDLLRACIDSIERTAAGETIRIVVIDHASTDRRTVQYLQRIAKRHTVMPYEGVFNYARMNNLAVKTHGAGAAYYLFLNNDVAAISPGWIGRLRSLAGRPGVGAVGPLLLYGDDRVQHAGVLVGFSGAADHAMKFQDAYLANGERHPGYNCSMTAVRDYSAVTAACMMVPRAVWRAVRGFDERFVIGFNDTDLCLRIIKAGYRVLYDGYTVLYHHESATRTTTNEVDHPGDDAQLRRRWPRFFDQGDPFYNPLLAPRGTDHVLRQDPGYKGRMAPRATTLTRR